MATWRKPHPEGHHQLPYSTRSSSFSSYHRKPPLDIWQPTVPTWEKMFCSTVGSVPWRKLVETQKYLEKEGKDRKVMKWNDSAGKEAFDNAKKRFYAATNGLPCDISLPDPDIYIDEVDWNSTVDPELILELERAATVPVDVKKDEEIALIGPSLLLDPSFPLTPNGWGEDEDEAEATEPWKLTDLVPHAQNLAPNNDAGQCEWRNFENDPWRWNRRNNRGGGGWNRRTWYGYNGRGEGMSWFKAPAYHHGDEFQASRGRWNNRGGKRTGSFHFNRPRANNMPNAW